MKKPLPIGTSDFKSLIDKGCLYIDKSLFIQELIENDDEVVLITRPRRFGKTLNLSMLRYFFDSLEEDRSYLFKDLKIWDNETCRAMQGKYPVIFLSFKDVKHSSWEKAFEGFQSLLSEAFLRHEYLLNGEILNKAEKDDFNKILLKEGSQVLTENSLKHLIKWLHHYHKNQVILLIDEYDTPVHSAYVGKFYEHAIEFIRNLLSGCLKDSSHLKKGVLTGILRITKESIFSGLNNVSTFTVLSETFNDKFGLLESEVSGLLENYDLLPMLPEFKKWYNGYRVGSCNGIYNPWSVLKCVADNGAFYPYWVNTSDNALMKQLIARGSADLKADIEVLLRGGIVEKRIEDGIVFPMLDQVSGLVWSLLLYCGYLTIETTPSYGISCRLCIPNIEVGELYRTMILEWFERSIEEHKYSMLLNTLIKGDVDTFSRLFQEFMLSSVSVFDVPLEESEKIYHAFILGMLVGLKDRYEVKSNRESGLGRYDVMLIPKNRNELGIIMEFKKIDRFEKTDLENAVTSALKQIEDRKYDQELIDRGITNILYLGFAFEGKEVLIRSKFK